MKTDRLTLVMHAIIWILLLVVPYISTDQIFNKLRQELDLNYLGISLLLSTVLLGIFYINYFILIPKYILTKKFLLYFLTLFIAIISVLVGSSVLFYFSDFNPDLLSRINPLIEKIIPVIIINAVSLWLLAIVTSILWALYNRIKEIEEEKLAAQLASLKAQINPHFLFNTLNSIYATAIDTSPKTADMVDRLSEMMRYSMKDTQQEMVMLEDEIQYIRNYIELQKIRLDRSVKLEYTIEKNVPHLEIAPMLLIPFIENALKHGVNSEQKSYINIQIKVSNFKLHLIVVNSKVDIQYEISEKSGLGIENTRHRLELLYPNKHMLEIHDGNKTFNVELFINLV